MNKIKLIVGLGNPRKEYEHTRHNAGFSFIDFLENNFKNKKTILAKTQIFMNESGRAVAKLLKSNRMSPKNILIVHDDIDIPWGNFKFSFGRSSAGHKGVESIIKTLKTKNFWRLRIGIQPATEKRVKAEKIILKKFTPKELEKFDEIFKKAVFELKTAF